MIIVVRVGLGLAYQGVSSGTPYHRHDYYHDPSSSSSAPSSGRRKSNRQLSTFRAASRQDDNGLQSISLGSSGSSSGTKLDIGTPMMMRSDSRVGVNDLYGMDRSSQAGDSETEKNGEKERTTA